MQALSLFILGAIFGTGALLIFLEYSAYKRDRMREEVTIRLADNFDDSRYIHVRPLDENFEPVDRPLTEEEFKRYEDYLHKIWKQR